MLLPEREDGGLLVTLRKQIIIAVLPAFHPGGARCPPWHLQPWKGGAPASLEATNSNQKRSTGLSSAGPVLQQTSGGLCLRQGKCYFLLSSSWPRMRNKKVPLHRDLCLLLGNNGNNSNYSGRNKKERLLRVSERNNSGLLFPVEVH